MQFYNDTGPGGAEQMIVDLSRGLRRTGHEVTVALMSRGWLQDELERAGVPTALMPKRRRVDVAYFRRVGKFLRNNAIQVIHAHEFNSNVSGCVIGRMTGIPVVATVHGREYVASRLRRRIAYRWVGRTAGRVVAVSGTIRRFLAEGVGLRGDNVATIYNGIDTERYEGTAGSDPIRRELGIGPGALVVGAVGSLYAVKGHVHLIRALADVARDLPDVACIVAGRGELRAELEDEARRLGLHDRVRFLGYRSDVPRLLAAMDVFVLPSLSEGLPLSLLEAMAAGVPVVATEVGGNAEVIDDGATGFLVPPRRSDLLAERIREVLGDRSRARAMSLRARRSVQERFSADRMVRDYERLFGGLLAERSA